MLQYLLQSHGLHQALPLVSHFSLRGPLDLLLLQLLQQRFLRLRGL